MTGGDRTGSVRDMTLLTSPEIADALEKLPGWGGDTTDIRCRYAATDFPAAIALVDAVAIAAEDADHHPDIDIRWREVLFVLATHSEGGVTAKDVEMARTIDGLARQSGAAPAGRLNALRTAGAARTRRATRGVECAIGIRGLVRHHVGHPPARRITRTTEQPDWTDQAQRPRQSMSHRDRLSSPSGASRHRGAHQRPTARFPPLSRTVVASLRCARRIAAVREPESGVDHAHHHRPAADPTRLPAGCRRRRRAASARGTGRLHRRRRPGRAPRRQAVGRRCAPRCSTGATCRCSTRPGSPGCPA